MKKFVQELEMVGRLWSLIWIMDVSFISEGQIIILHYVAAFNKDSYIVTVY